MKKSINVLWLVMLLTVGVSASYADTYQLYTTHSGNYCAGQDNSTSLASDIIWYNKDNTVRKTISITSSTGTWTNVSANGLITFNVTREESSGIAQFWKAEGETKVRIHLVSATGAEIYELSVTNVEVQ